MKRISVFGSGRNEKYEDQDAAIAFLNKKHSREAQYRAAAIGQSAIGTNAVGQAYTGRSSEAEKEKSEAAKGTNEAENEENEGNEGGEESEAGAEAGVDNALRENSGTGGNVTTKSGGCCIHAMIIAGQIEGHFAASPQTKSTKYEQLIPALVAVEESDEIDGLLLLLNTIGGDIEAGLAIAELVAGMTKPTVSLVLGGGHSIGIPLAVSAKKSFIVPSATMTLHPVRLNGLVIGVPQTFANLAKMQDRIVDFIVRHSNADSETIIRLMTRTEGMTTDIGTVLEGKEAVDNGIIDSLGGLGEAVAELKRMIRESKRSAEE